MTRVKRNPDHETVDIEAKNEKTYHEGVCVGLDCVDGDWRRRQSQEEHVARARPDVGCHRVTTEVVRVGEPGDARHDARGVDAAVVKKQRQQRLVRLDRPSSRQLDSQGYQGSQDCRDDS